MQSSKCHVLPEQHEHFNTSKTMARELQYLHTFLAKITRKTETNHVTKIHYEGEAG